MDGNIFSALPCAKEITERFETLHSAGEIRIERIVSTGQCSPPGFWYEQHAAEWVILLQGAAVLRFADETGERELKPGDWLYIAPLRRHRVEATAGNEPSVWLAVHFPEEIIHKSCG